VEDGNYSQAFPFLGGGGDRKGKPIMAFARIDDRPVRLRSKVHEPDYVIVQDSSITDEVDVLAGLKENGLALINSEKTADELGLSSAKRLVIVPASRMAREMLGRPVVNTALAGIFAAVTGEVTLPSLLKAVQEKFPGELGEQNARLVELAYQEAKGKG
jgi:pyruvate ferredoxin oxidoreductase gamma subunit